MAARTTRRAPLVEEEVRDALSSPAHRRILAATIAKPRSVKEICGDTGLPLASAYRNVKSMEERGLIIVERSAMTVDGKPYDLYRSRVDEARLTVSRRGIEVSWDVNHDVEDRILHMWNYLGS